MLQIGNGSRLLRSNVSKAGSLPFNEYHHMNQYASASPTRMTESEKVRILWGEPLGSFIRWLELWGTCDRVL